jgi:hypothetical protein
MNRILVGLSSSRRPAAVAGVIALALPACGGGSSAAPTRTPVTETQTFMGAANPSCQLGGHNFEAAEGAISVTLVQTTGGLGLYGQVCANGIDNNDCSINQTAMTVGQTLAGVRKGASTQNVKMLTLNCGPGPAPPGPVDYTIRVTYQR